MTVSVEVKDEFNSLPQGYESNLLLFRQDGTAAAILEAPFEFQGLEDYLFNAFITSGLLPAGTYLITAEVRDPDGNEHRLKSGEITVN